MLSAGNDYRVRCSLRRMMLVHRRLIAVCTFTCIFLVCWLWSIDFPVVRGLWRRSPSLPFFRPQYGTEEWMRSQIEREVDVWGICHRPCGYCSHDGSAIVCPMVVLPGDSCLRGGLAICERGPDGRCGFRDTAEFRNCVAQDKLCFPRCGEVGGNQYPTVPQASMS